jgi:hypothetical protein
MDMVNEKKDAEEKRRLTGREFKNQILQQAYALMCGKVDSNDKYYMKSEGVYFVAIYPSVKNHFSIDCIKNMSLNPIQQIELARRLDNDSKFFMRGAVEALLQNLIAKTGTKTEITEDMIKELSKKCFDKKEDDDSDDADIYCAGDMHAG